MRRPLSPALPPPTLLLKICIVWSSSVAVVSQPKLDHLAAPWLEIFLCARCVAISMLPSSYYKYTATHETPRGTHGGPRGVVQQIPKGGYNIQGVSTLTPHICSGRASIEVISTGLALATWSRNILAASSTLISGGGVLF